MPTADVGPGNPLPPLFSTADLHTVADPGEADAEMRHNIGYGRVHSVLPYLVQDGYGRERRPVEHKVAVLENEVLRATFLLDLGGRLWSLVHKPTGRELLYRNPVSSRRTSPCGTRGSPAVSSGTSAPSVTHPRRASRCTPPGCCSRTARRCCGCTSSSGCVRSCSRSTPGCPTGSPVLLVHVRIVNPNDVETPMYWWSNVAVPQADDIRVLAPADAAWQFAYDSPLRRVPIPVHDGQDRTYTTRAARGRRLLLRDRRRPAALGRRPGRPRHGTGADLHRPAPRPQAVPVGQGPGRRPLAGVARAARSGVPRDPGRSGPHPAGAPAHAGRASWSWVEAYGLLQSDPDAVHGDDWTLARAVVSRDLEELIPRAAARRGADRRGCLGRRRPGRGAERRVGLGSARAQVAGAGR